MAYCHLILGGARSGKSRFAEQLALANHTKSNSDELWYLATATAGDKEMTSRIADHQKRRGAEWRLFEEPIELAPIIMNAQYGTTILIDCLTLWLSNCLHQDTWPDARRDFFAALSSTPANIIMVSNEVGSGIVPLGELSREFVDQSGWLHQEIATIASNVSLIVAGLEMPLKRSQ